MLLSSALEHKVQAFLSTIIKSTVKKREVEHYWIYTHEKQGNFWELADRISPSLLAVRDDDEAPFTSSNKTVTDVDDADNPSKKIISRSHKNRILYIFSLIFY